MQISDILSNPSLRESLFPVVTKRVFLAHAGVTALPKCVADGISSFAESGALNQQEAGRPWASIDLCRASAAKLLGAEAQEIALLGPTSLGLSLVANGIDWKPGDEVVFFQDDYPANVYAWINLERRGVKLVRLKPEQPGWITWETVQAAITPKTRLVSVASAHFLSGFRVPIEQIGPELKKRGILFCLDGIQTLGAFPIGAEYVDFVSADAHKWLLGPVGIGIFFVKKEHLDTLRPSLLGSWNVESPNFIAQENIAFYPGARRYEPGSLNLPGIMGMHAAINLILDVGLDNITQRILILRALLRDKMLALGFTVYPGKEPAPEFRSGIITFDHPTADLEKIWNHLTAENVSVSLRQRRDGRSFLRFSPHFYNTEDEIEQAVSVIRSALG